MWCTNNALARTLFESCYKVNLRLLAASEHTTPPVDIEMCNEHQLMSTMLDMKEKRYRRNKLHHTLSALLLDNQTGGSRLTGVYEGPQSLRMSFKKTMLIFTALVAFLLGLVVGVLIPLCMMPKYTKQNLKSPTISPVAILAPDFNNLESPEKEVRFHPVTFVNDAAPRLIKHFKRKKGPSNGVVQGIYWSDHVESLLPAGFNASDTERWQRIVRSSTVVKIEEGCGRMQNRLLTFEDGTRACCRYRQNTDQIQGELFSFYLGRLLDLNNLVPSFLTAVKTRDPMWAKVKAQISLAQWVEDRPVVLTQFVDHLQPATIPQSFRAATRRLHPPDVLKEGDKIVELVQWSDLIVFDYLTANLDRIVNNLYNLQWNPEMMNAPAHNLAKNQETDLLLFLDNESGLLHGYRLIDKYESYHSVFLNALCVFRKSTADMIVKLRSQKNVGQLLNRHLSDAAQADVLPGLPERSAKILNTRIDRVHAQIAWCQKQYGEDTNFVET